MYRTLSETEKQRDRWWPFHLSQQRLVRIVLGILVVWTGEGMSAGTTKPSEKDAILLTFPDNVPLKTVIDYVSIRLKKNIIYDETLVNRTVTIRSTVPVAEDQLLPLLRSAMRFRGLSLIPLEQTGWLKVVPDEKLSEEVSTCLLDRSGPSDPNGVITALVRLNYIPPKDFGEMVKTLLSKPGGNAFELSGSRTLIVTDYKNVVDAVLQLQKHIDDPRYQNRWRLRRLKNIPVERIAEDLKIFGDTPDARTDKEGAGTGTKLAVPIPWINSVLLRGTAEQIGRMEAVIDVFDVPKHRQQWKVRRLRNVPISRILSDLNKLIRQTCRTSGDKADGKEGSAVLAVPWINAVVLQGTSKDIQEQEKILEILDAPASLRTRIYHLKNTAALRAATVLRQVVAPMKQSACNPGDWMITPDEEGNALVVTCPEPFHKEIQRWIEARIDLPSEDASSGLSTRVFQIRYARASELLPSLENVLAAYGGYGRIRMDAEDVGRDAAAKSSQDVVPSKETEETKGVQGEGASRIRMDGKNGEKVPFSLTVHEGTNSIIATAPTHVLAQLERMIQRLDHHRPQVMIDVTIVSIKETRTFDLGVELHFLRASEETGLLKKGAATSFGLLELDPATGVPSATFGTGLNAVLLRPNEVSAILRACQSRLNGRVTAKPRLLIDDNTTGFLNSVDEAPYTSINAGQTVSTTSFAGYAEAGTQVTLTPHISEGDIVHLEYEIRSSSFTGGSSDVNIPPPRATDYVRSQVAIPSGFVLLVGGLTRENEQKSRSGVPYLSDIPFLGELLRIRNNSDNKTVLYIFLRPVILREDRFAYLGSITSDGMKEAKITSGLPILKMEFLR